MSENLEASNVPSIVPTVSSSLEAPVTESKYPTPPSPNPKQDSQPHTASSPTQSSSGSHQSRKTSNRKRFVATTSPFASPEKMAEGETVEEEENQEVSSLRLEESSEQQAVVRTSDESAMTTPGLDLNVANPIGNTPHVPSEFTLGTIGEPHEGPDPSNQEEPSAPTWDETPCSSKEPQVSTDPAPSPHFYDEPFTIVALEMRSMSEEENGSGNESSVRVIEISNVEVGESGEKVAEESGEKVSEKVYEKSTKKEKSVRK
ncbi:uncharacterized protein [Nicotiana tomentosiformis]|uniref:uncharacterized protein n=1 Tax=Nicotiana tomentosiformis TaxID=4098 RepID=UPI00388C9D34